MSKRVRQAIPRGLHDHGDTLKGPSGVPKGAEKAIPRDSQDQLPNLGPMATIHNFPAGLHPIGPKSENLYFSTDMEFQFTTPYFKFAIKKSPSEGFGHQIIHECFMFIYIYEIVCFQQKKHALIL